MNETSQLLPLLERYWGFRTFRPLQREAAEAILGGRDSVVVLPTGGGKSLCYQLPALTSSEGLAVVISPLIALMKDQVDGLVQNGVPAAYFNSSLTSEQQGRVAERLRQGRYRILYVSPERLVGERGERFCRLLGECGLTFVAVDEAHCISQWGHDFRPEYRQLARLRDTFPDLSLHAFTATATEHVRRDIAEQLKLRDALVLVGSFDRPNLCYRAVRLKDVNSQVTAAVGRHKGEAGIVYCQSRRKVEKLTERLSSEGYRAVAYHAGLPDEVRRRHQDEFINERVDVIVATLAFGMGIDRSNVRFVIHAGAPRSLEHYQQEAGRAGRDGLEAECLLIYSPADFAAWRQRLESSGELTDAARTQLRDIERYAAQTRCRHRVLCEYFGEAYEGDGCGACDWCLGELERIEDPIVLAQKILSCVLRLRESWGMGQVIDVLRGRPTEKVKSRRHDELSTFGLLADATVPELRGYVEQLAEQGFVRQAGEARYPVVQVTPEGRRLLKAEAGCILYRHRVPEKRKRQRPPRGRAAVSWEGVDRSLFEELRRLRREIAQERQVPPYVIFHDSVLRQLARERPTSPEELLELHGVGAKKAADLGPRFLELLAVHSSPASTNAQDEEVRT